MPSELTATPRGKLSARGGSRSAIAAVVAAALAGDGGDGAVGRNLADPAVVRVGDVDVAGCVHRDAHGLVQLALMAGPPSPLKPAVRLPAKLVKCAGGDEFRHAMIAGVGDIERAAGIEPQPIGVISLPPVPLVPPVAPT